MMTSS